MADESWTISPLGELTENLDFKRVPVKGAERRTGPFPYYGASGIVDHVDGYIFDGEHLLIAEDGENLRTRNTPVAFLADGKFWVNNHAHIVRGNEKANTRFLMYALAQADISGYLTGSTMPKLTQGNMNRIPILHPRRAEQDAIVDVLSSLDDKIDLNRRMNATLEAMARAMFRSWFVDFDPVLAKFEGRHPYGLDEATATLFPGSFEESAMGGIPSGWEVKRLSDLCSTQYGYTASAASEPIGPKFLRVMDINKQDWIDWSSVPHCQIDDLALKSYSLQVGDLVVARMADPGKSALIDEATNAIFASYLVRLKTTSLAESYFLFGYLKSAAYTEYVEGAKGGSVQANMNAKVIVGVSLVVPPKQVIEKYFHQVRRLREKIASNLRQSRTLASLRDALLPKLLSGEIRIQDAEALRSPVG